MKDLADRIKDAKNNADSIESDAEDLSAATEAMYDKNKEIERLKGRVNKLVAILGDFDSAFVDMSRQVGRTDLNNE